MSVKFYQNGELIPISGPVYAMGQFPGQMTLAANINAPAGWLKCDGKAYLKTDYPLLYEAIGDTYNASGTPADKFCVPDMVGKYALGAADSGNESLGKSVSESLPNIRGWSWTALRDEISGNGAMYKASHSNGVGWDEDRINESTGFNAQKTLIPKENTGEDQWDEINNPAYKDPVQNEDGTYSPVKVRPDSVALNYFIKY